MSVSLLAHRVSSVLGEQLLRWQGLAPAGRASPVSAIALSVILGLLLSGLARAASVFRSVGEAGVSASGAAYGFLDPSSWVRLIRLLGEQSAGLLLGTALAAVGLSTRLSVFRELGIAPLLLGLAASLAVSLSALGLAATVGPLLDMARP